MAKKTTTIKASRGGYCGKIKPKAISRTRKDIKSWRSALQSADNVENPRRMRLIELYNDIMIDSLLSSQIEQRFAETIGSNFVVSDASGKEHEEATKTLREAIWLPVLVQYILESIAYGHSLVEVDISGDQPDICLIPRQNVIPTKGVMLYDVGSDSGIAYRDEKEFGTWVFEFGRRDDYGFLNRAVPHVLMKRFAQSCWSELCEIYGIPPRYIKTNTQDTEMLDRAESMMRDMGSAAWWIIDSEEELGFATGVTTSGDVYSNLISLCNSEMSMLISGAQIGQDTKNGNRSKEETSVKQLSKRIKADKKYVEDYMNSTVMPALYRIGVIPDGLSFAYMPEEDLERLWKMVTECFQAYDVDSEWIKEKFGIMVTGTKQLQQPVAGNKKLEVNSFFD